MDTDSLIAVAEDIEYLATWGHDISNAEIRRGTSVLRRLLVEDAYGSAWRAMGNAKQPLLPAVDIAYQIGNDANSIVIAVAGGALIRGIPVAGILLTTAPILREPLPSVRENGYAFERMYTISEYLASQAGLLDGVSFTRREVIKYLANVKGGVHLNPKQRKAEEKLVARLGKIEDGFAIQCPESGALTDGLLIEAAACASSISSSIDGRLLVSQIRSHCNA